MPFNTGPATGWMEAGKYLADTAFTQAKTAETQVDAETKGIELAARKRLMEMSGVQTDGAVSKPSMRPSELFASRAMDAANLGALDYAGKFIQMASHASTAEKNQLERTLKQNEYLAQKLGGVTDQDSWETVIADFETTFGKPAPQLRQIPYSSKAIKQMREELQTLDKASLIQVRRAREARMLVQDKLTNASIALKKALEKNVNERTKRLDKAGKPSGSPKLEDQIAAERVILSLHPEMEGNKSSLQEASYSIAAQAKVLQSKNPGLDMDMAIRQAARMEEEAGSFQSTSTTLPIIGEVNKKGKFIGGGKTPADALSPPTDMKKLAPGKYYYNASGAVGFWNGKKMQMLKQSDYASQLEDAESVDEDLTEGAEE